MLSPLKVTELETTKLVLRQRENMPVFRICLDESERQDDRYLVVAGRYMGGTHTLILTERFRLVFINLPQRIYLQAQVIRDSKH